MRTSKLLNWEVEFKRWCPGLKILLYLGNKKERRSKRMVGFAVFKYHLLITTPHKKGPFFSTNVCNNILSDGWSAVVGGSQQLPCVCDILQAADERPESFSEEEVEASGA